MFNPRELWFGLEKHYKIVSNCSSDICECQGYPGKDMQSKCTMQVANIGESTEKDNRRGNFQRSSAIGS